MRVIKVAQRGGELTTLGIKKRLKKVPNFRGVYSRDTLPKKPKKKERAVSNLDISTGPGSHWVSWKKSGNEVKYLDPIGNLKAPRELVEYLGPKAKIRYNKKRFQKLGSKNCGELCVKFLKNDRKSRRNRKRTKV